MKKYIFLDTNNWIYLSNGYNILSNKFDELHLKIFDIIKKRTNEGSLVFLVNNIVIEEWKRNKPHTEDQIKELEKKHLSYKNSLKAIEAFLSKDVKEFKVIESFLLETYQKKTIRLKIHIKEVEDFLINTATKIDLTDDIKIIATDLALEKKAPFVGDKKNSMADALIFLNSLDYIYKNLSIQFPTQKANLEEGFFLFPDSYFVSSNSGDFSSPEDKEKIHPDLYPFLQKTNTKFFFTLGKLINHLEKEFLTREEEFEIEHVDDSIFCTICQNTYYPSVSFSEYFLIPDENKGPNLVNQYRIKFSEEDDIVYKPDDFMSLVRTATCTYCSAEYIECTCGELNQIVTFNVPFSCTGQCGNAFIVHADIDRKGLILDFDYEIIKDSICQECGKLVDSLNYSGLCFDCENAYSNK